ncbi:hypothetical protein DZA28_13935 [Pseudomonas alloputida]|uniref:DUF6630 domain-containing protein n=2 Tax=Pseudomonas alloputida TaxID=1940621 RepID=A0ABY3D5Q8_9PSED|nr:hypothetical protein [Pseudomonas alloputida]TRZ60977.1 hypothetical protein DZA28_13935 [Pseudomonas alloputida]
MGLFSRLFGGRYTQPPPDEPRMSDAAIMRELYPLRSQLKIFTQALLARLPEKERMRLVRRVLRYYNQGEDPATALVSGLLDAEKGQSLSHLILMAVDVRGFDDFEYLAPKLVEASGIDQVYACRHEGTQSLMQVLIDFDQWLIGVGKRFLHVDTGGADYVGCIIEQDGVENLIALAKQAGIDARLDPF